MSAVNTEIQYSLTVNTEMTYSELRKLETVLMRVMGYVQRFSGNTDLNKFLEMIQKLIVTVRSLQMAIRALQLASGPIGWAYAATTIAGTALSGYSLYESLVGV